MAQSRPMAQSRSMNPVRPPRRRMTRGSAYVHDRRNRSAAFGALMGGRYGDEYGRVAGDRGGHTADGRLDLAVPMHVGVVEHRVAASTHGAVLTGFTFEEDVHQTVAQIRGMRPLRQLETRVADRVPDAVGVHGIVHHRMADAVVAAHA